MDLGVYTVSVARLVALVSAVLALGIAAACGGGSDDDSSGNGGADGGGGSGGVLDGGGTIPDAPTGENFCAPGACNYQAQDCPSGQSCLPTDTPATGADWAPKCFPAGTKAAGEACTQWSECAAGHFCAGVSTGSPGTCRQLCCGGDWSACPAGQSCYQELFLLPPGASDPVYANADLCAPVNDCDVFDASSCASGKACHIVDPTGNVACVTAGTAELGEDCSASERCVAGFACVGGACRRLCNASPGGGEPSCPPAEGICVHFVRNPPNVGECTPTG
jgi:hypothetical protein